MKERRNAPTDLEPELRARAKREFFFEYKGRKTTTNWPREQQQQRVEMAASSICQPTDGRRTDVGLRLRLAASERQFVCCRSARF